MANEVVSLDNLTRFKGKCDDTYAKKLYWHTITCSFNGGDEVKFSIQTHKSTALTKADLKALTTTPKPTGGYYYALSLGDLTFALLYIQVDVLNKLQVFYISEDTWGNTSKINSSNWTLTDVVEAVS